MAEADRHLDFVMQGAREAMSAGLTHVQEQVAAIEQAVTTNPGLAFDLSKTLIESVCRTILTERSLPADPGDDLPKLFKTATTLLPFLPPSASGDADIRKKLVQTLNGLSTAVQGICELRNSCGFASHGSDSARPQMAKAQALLAAEAADVIVGFLHRIHREERTITINQPIRYDDQPDFNESIDEQHELIHIFDEAFEPSKVLFEMAPESYRIYLSEYEPASEANALPAEDEGTQEDSP